MTIGICTLGCDAGRSGIGRYALEVAGGLARGGPRVEVVSRSDEAGEWSHAAPSARHLALPLLGGALTEILVTLVILPLIALVRRWDVAVFPAGNRRLPLWMPCPTVGTVHDVSILHLPEKYDGWRRRYILGVLPFLQRRLTRVVTVSRTSARDIAATSGIAEAEIAVVPNGVAHDRFSPAPRGEPGAPPAGGSQAPPFFLYVARLEHPGKNHMVLIDAFERFKERHPGPHRLVFAGPDRERADEVHARIAASPAREWIACTGYISDTRLMELYRTTIGFLFPSLYEGFGIPALEAMACAVPVVVSSCPALDEVAGGVCPTLDPRDAGAWADAMAELIAPDGGGVRAAAVEAGVRRAAGFTWAVTVSGLRTCIDEATERRAA